MKTIEVITEKTIPFAKKMSRFKLTVVKVAALDLVTYAASVIFELNRKL